MATGKRLKKSLTLASVLAALLLVWLLLPIRMVKTGNRTQDWAPDKELKEQIVTECKGMTDMAIVRYGMKRTAKMLRYTEKNRIADGKANCVGYAKVYSAICNVAFRANGSKSTAKPVVGDVTLFGISLCKVLRAMVPDRWKNFVKDHDFVEFHLADRSFCQDACVYDIMWKPCRTMIKTE